MIKNTDIQIILNDVKDMFSSSAVECINAIFNISVHIKEKWSVTERLSGKFQNIFYLGNANNNFQGISIIGINDETVHKILTLSKLDHNLLDAFGEADNIFCGIIMDNTKFTSKFGILTQSVPQYSSGDIIVPKAWGVSGKIYLKNDWIYFGYAIRKARFFFK